MKNYKFCTAFSASMRVSAQQRDWCKGATREPGSTNGKEEP